MKPRSCNLSINCFLIIKKHNNYHYCYYLITTALLCFCLCVFNNYYYYYYSVYVLSNFYLLLLSVCTCCGNSCFSFFFFICYCCCSRLINFILHNLIKLSCDFDFDSLVSCKFPSKGTPEFIGMLLNRLPSSAGQIWTLQDSSHL